MTATDELRRLMDERGVEYTVIPEDMYGSREYIKIGGTEIRTNGRGEVAVFYLTPEQAIEATLGRGECELEHLIIDGVVDAWECSECGMFCTVVQDDEGGIYKPNYCPSCGRKVRA